METKLFSNMFKSLFGESITPTSSQFVPITASDGTPAGISSMANLASVLGVGKYANFCSSESDFETNANLYNVYTCLVSNVGIFISIKCYDATYVQFKFNGGIWYRESNGGAWTKVI